MIRDALKEEYKDKGSGFYTYKTPKVEKGGYRDQITAEEEGLRKTKTARLKAPEGPKDAHRAVNGRDK